MGDMITMSIPIARGVGLKIFSCDTEAMFSGGRTRLPLEYFDEPCPGGPPKCAGVYAVLARNWPGTSGEEHIVYIGSAANVYKRVMNPNHIYRRLYSHVNGCLVYTRTFRTEDYREWEKAAIRQFRPLLNIQHKYTRG